MKPNSRCLSYGLLLALLAAAGSAAAQQPPSCDTAEHRQFDFWLGAWEVTTPDGQPAGVNTVSGILNGCALQESWRGSKGSIGRSLNMYYAGDGQWHQSWVDGAGGRLDLTGGLDRNGRMVLSGRMPGSDGAEVLHEISWEALEDGTVRQHWRVLKDGEEDWQDAFVGIYRPVEDSSTSADGRD